MPMRGKMLFLTGAAVGYVFGSRAGRKRYDQLKAAVDRVRDTPAFQHQMQQAQDFAARKLGEVPGLLVDVITGRKMKHGTAGE